MLVGGGLLALPGLELVPDPELASRAAALDGLLSRFGLPGCAVGALLDGPSLGLADSDAGRGAWAAAQSAGASVAPLHLDTVRVSADLIGKVAKLRGA